MTGEPQGLVLRGLAVGYPRRGWRRRTPHTVLSGLFAHARPGELTVLLGPNGAGKSTLLRTLCGLQPPLAGWVCLDGADLRTMDRVRLARSLAVVLTERVDIALLTVRELVALGRHPYTPATGRLGEADGEVVARALETVGAGHLAGRRLSEISDGERQRVMIARALAQQPDLVLLDEPTAFLDVSGRAAIIALLGRLAREQGLTVVVSTHELNLALPVADVLWLIDRAGRLHVGTPDEMTRSGIVVRALELPT
ncbi:MAG: ATP-binding cassette domain-containing protein [Streptosporangiales bacterium]|nr:ATP-binding cassette domain-containing protein [Streptosporangiales bacterium]